jgi:Domain of unknown function (DUF3598)
MYTQEQHWENLFGYLGTESIPWYGIWTVYSPEKEVIKSSQGIRNLRANVDKTIITHTNQFPLPDGTIQEKQWQIEKETCNRLDGLLHPADSSKRAFSLVNDGASAWVSQKLESEHNFSVELFLRHEDWNTSIGSIYDGNGYLEKILYLREHLGSYPGVTQGSEIKSVSGNWIGKKQSITSNLKISAEEEIQGLVLDPTQGNNETFYLPDGVVVNIPKQVKIEKPFDIVAGKFVTDNIYKRLTARYDNFGAFALLTSEVLHTEL